MGGEKKGNANHVVVCSYRVSLAWFFVNGWVNGGQRVPGVEMSGTLGDVGCYEFGDYEIVYCCVVNGAGRRGCVSFD